MNLEAGWALIAAGALLLLGSWLWLQRRVSELVSDVLTGLAGLLAAVGGLLLLHDVPAASWVVGPLLVTGGIVLHRRVLFHGEGPFRT